MDQPNWILKKCGSPSYIAPEVFLCKKYNEKCDIFSVGIIFYILLTEEMPFDADNLEKVLKLNELCRICYNHKRLELTSKPLIDLLKGML